VGISKRMTPPYPTKHRCTFQDTASQKAAVQAEVVHREFNTGVKRRRKPKCHLGTELQVLLFLEVPLLAPVFLKYTTSTSPLGDNVAQTILQRILYRIPYCQKSLILISSSDSYCISSDSLPIGWLPSERSELKHQYNNIQ